MITRIAFLKFIILFVSIPFILTGCENDKINIPDTGRKLVINGLITTDTTLNVRISKSYYYNAQSDILFDSINNARVLIFSNSNYLDSLRLVKNYYSDYFFYSSNYWSKNIVPTSGKEYSIVVKGPGYPDASASIMVPNLVKIERLDTSRFLVPPNPNYPDMSNVRFKCQINFTDPIYETNYYLIRVSRYSRFEWWTENLDIRISSQDPIVEQKMALIGDEVYAIAFTDKAINGEKYGLQFIIDANEIGVPFIDNRATGNGKPIPLYKTVVYFRLYSISEEYFWYIKTLNLYNKNFNNPLTEPVLMFSNVKNGYGIFAAAAVSCDSLVFDFQ
jgi:hypothetical protein